MDRDPDSIGARIVRARLSMAMTQTAFAEHVGVSFRTVQQWEQGRSEPSIETLRQLALKLRPSFTLEYLLAIEEPVAGEQAVLPARPRKPPRETASSN